MLEILEDPPTTREIPHDSVAKQCDPFCTNATESVCISGYKTLGKPQYSLQRWRERKSQNDDKGDWTYGRWMGNPQALILGEGGQGNNDIKEQWSSRTVGDVLVFVFEAKQYGFVAIEGDQIEHLVNDAKSVEIWLNLVDMENGQVIDNASKSMCIETKEKKKHDWWTLDNGLGCHINGLAEGQKYEIVIRVVQNTDVGVKNIRVW